MKRLLHNALEFAARAVPRLNVVLGLIGVVAGFAILATCTTAGTAPHGRSFSGGSTFLLGLGAFMVVIALTAFFVGTIYLIVRASADIHAVRQRLDSRQDPPAPDDAR